MENDYTPKTVYAHMLHNHTLCRIGMTLKYIELTIFFDETC